MSRGMFVPAQIEPVLANYGDDCQPTQIEPVGVGMGFSGASIWRLTAPRGPLALRRWPRGHPSTAQLEFIHDVQRYVAAQGFDLAPVPIRTRHGDDLVESEGHLWELTPWLSGVADYFPQRLPEKLAAAHLALADFHLAAASFPTRTATRASPGIEQRLGKLQSLRGDRLQCIVAAATRGIESDTEVGSDLSGWIELGSLVPRCAALFAAIAPAAGRHLALAGRLEVPMQPSLRDVWSDHVLFEGLRVSGLIDFGAMRIESVAGDVARLLGSMAGDDPAAWRLGLAAYQSVRPLSADELALVTAFDQSTTLLSAWSWFEWVFVDHRTFADPVAVTARVRQIVSRLEVLASNTLASASQEFGGE
jgi:Ser/Thr protein kinase RdoA (MazF antagonist)